MPPTSRQPLPIDPLLPEIVSYLERNTVTLLQADPGAGKTTRVPSALLDAGFHEIYVLEPRRLAARLAARRVAAERGETVGETIGYQVRFEQMGSPRTKLWFLTEGVLTRKLLSRRSLASVKVVILDEFHERHLETDLALALLRNLQISSRPDLRLLIMSATLAAGELATELGNPPLIRAPGRLFPVTARFTPHSANPLEEQVAAAVGQALTETTGHVLVFLPGSAEIRKSLQTCQSIANRAGANQPGAKVLPLHGDLRLDEQELAIAPSDTRKIILSTNVAESSVTIDGVEAVVDSGLARVSTYSHWSGLSRLGLEKISKSSAIQRAGRAGRTSPGLVIRLYSESDFVRGPDQIVPEIARADLAPLTLQLASAGFQIEDLPWIEGPRPEMWQSARTLLIRLGALDPDGVLTDAGRQMAALNIHPRLARFVITAAQLGSRHEACELASHLADTRLRFGDDMRADRTDLELIATFNLSHSGRKLKAQLLSATEFINARSTDPFAIEKAFLHAYPDRVARKRGDTLLLCSGNSAKLSRASSAHSEFLVAIEMEDAAQDAAAKVRIASMIKPDWLLDFFPERVEAREDLSWNREAERVEQVNSLLYDQLTIDESRSILSRGPAAAELLGRKALEAGWQRFADSEEIDRLLSRVHFAAQHSSAIQFEENLIADALRQLAVGMASFAELRDASRSGGLLAAIESRFSMKVLNVIAPSHVTPANGRRARIEYIQGQPPSVASRLQDFFGMKESPSVACGAVPLVVKLLAPNQRPVQVTTDLVSFWKNLYPQLRKDLGRRYPKHSWPELPA